MGVEYRCDGCHAVMHDASIAHVHRIECPRQRACAGMSLVVIVCCVLAVLVLVAGCRGIDDVARAGVRALEAQGFSNIAMTDYAWFRCERGEVGLHFEATNPAGARVGGYVCCGLMLKGCTVRW